LSGSKYISLDTIVFGAIVDEAVGESHHLAWESFTGEPGPLKKQMQREQ
jgi:hypothetical protein